jgi:cardiolipin synthase
MSITEWAVSGAAVITVLQWLLIPRLLAQRSKSPPAILAWLWALLLFPAVGALLYILIGSERVVRRRLRLNHELKARLSAAPRESSVDGASLDMPELAHVNGFPATAGNSVALLPDGTSFFPVLLEVIAGAQHHLHLEFYIWNRDRAGVMVRNALVQAAQRGVQVRVLVDEMGSLWLRRSFFKPLMAAGGEFSWFHTFSPTRGRFHLNLRNHRKLVIADGATALTGGMNIGDEYWGGSDAPPHRDLAVRLRGPVVSQLAAVFAQDWLFSTGQALTDPACYPPAAACGNVAAQVVPGAPDNDIDEIQLTTLALLHRARERIRLMTPYFVPEPPLLAALQLAAMRGVDVAILVPEKCDHFYLTHVMRSYYDDLLPHGVRIFEYRPRLLHAKVVTVDGRWMMTGSANLDIRSLRLNFELNVLTGCTETTSAVDRLFEINARDAHEVMLAAYQKRPLRHKIAEAVFRPAAPLL